MLERYRDGGRQWVDGYPDAWAEEDWHYPLVAVQVDDEWEEIDRMRDEIQEELAWDRIDAMDAPYVNLGMLGKVSVSEVSRTGQWWGVRNAEYSHHTRNIRAKNSKRKGYFKRWQK